MGSVLNYNSVEITITGSALAVTQMLPTPRNGLLHSVKARLVSGTLATANIFISDSADSTVPDEAKLYESGVTAYVVSATTASLQDALVPPMPLTSQFQLDTDGERTWRQLLTAVPDATGSDWTIILRLTYSTGG